MKKFIFNKGFTLVEMIIATAIILGFVLVLVGVVNTYIKSSLRNVPATTAAYLAEEGIEAVKYMRQVSWSGQIATLSSEPYYLAWQSGSWTVTTTPSTIDSVYTRTVTVSSVQRDSSSNIVSSGGTVDPNTRQVTASVTWPYKNATTTRSLSTYITNLEAN
ncbi:MAG: prepilin-type N-terminal cleavage/methylation domain-containing protein [Patescibacteria group bacterium]